MDDDSKVYYLNWGTLESVRGSTVNYGARTAGASQNALAHPVRRYPLPHPQLGPDTGAKLLYTQLIPVTVLQDCSYCYSHLIAKETES